MPLSSIEIFFFHLIDETAPVITISIVIQAVKIPVKISFKPAGVFALKDVFRAFLNFLSTKLTIDHMSQSSGEFKLFPLRYDRDANKVKSKLRLEVKIKLYKGR